jgi:hypothetical protein
MCSPMGIARIILGYCIDNEAPCDIPRYEYERYGRLGVRQFWHAAPPNDDGPGKVYTSYVGICIEETCEWNDHPTHLSLQYLEKIVKTLSPQLEAVRKEHNLRTTDVAPRLYLVAGCDD